MPEFKSSLGAWRNPSQNIREYAPELKTILSSLNLSWGEASEEQAATPEELEEVIRRVEAAYRDDATITSGRDLRTLCQALWLSPYTLANIDSFRIPFLNNIRHLTITSPLCALGKQYLTDWPVTEHENGPIGGFLRTQRSRMTFGWLKTANDNGLFDGAKGVTSICHNLLTDELPISVSLRQTGLTDSVASGKFSEHVFTAACLSAQGRTTKRDIERLLDYFSPGRIEATNARFGGAAAKSALISILLGVGEPEPDLVRKRWCVKQLLRLFDDPRIRPAKWIDVDPALVTTAKQWLAKESLEQFLKVISDSLTDPDDQRRWKYRRAFWSSYVDSGRITEAWVHFGPNAERVAARLRTRTGDDVQYGRFKSVNRDHSVILMRAGDAVIAEYANIGKCWIWASQNHRGAPKLYQKVQKWSQCQNAPFDQVHGGADNYNWQRKVAEHLRSLGIPPTQQQQWVP